jgi:hypothetical protein
MMGVLYVISDRRSASTILQLASREGDDVSILLTREARGLFLDEEHRKSLEEAGRIFCLGDDESEPNLGERVDIMDYSGWVTLIEENERIVSWT